MRLVWCVAIAAAMLVSPGVIPKVRISTADGAQGPDSPSGAPVLPSVPLATKEPPMRLATVAPPINLAGLAPPRSAVKPRSDADQAPPIKLAALAPPRSAVEPRSGADQAPPKPEEPAAPEQPPSAEEEDEPSAPFVLLEAPDGPPTTDEVCAMLEAEANVRELPAMFFVRLIWQESRFNPRAVSPVGAQGIAQFMPATAAEHGLEDPFDVVKALGKSAQWLSELKEEFGNLGLAAAAYNAGPGRVQKWLDGKSKLPRETRDYVKIITGRPANDWKEGHTELHESLFEDVETVQDWCRSLPVERMAKTRIETAPESWGVQLAAGSSKKTALKRLASAKQRHSDVLEDLEPAVVRKRAPGRGRKPLYAVRVAVDTREAADELCSRLREDGGACTVLKN